MNNHDKKLNRKINIAFLLMFILIILVIISIVRNEHANSIDYSKIKTAKGDTVVGPIGPTGLQGKDGIDGRDGSNGNTTVIEKNTTVYQPVKGEKGDQGEKGDPGDPAALQQIRINPATGDLETKYTNDDFWNILVPCIDLLKQCGNTIDGTTY